MNFSTCGPTVTSLILMSLCGTLMAAGSAQAAESAGSIGNAAFEDSGGQGPAGWKTHTWGGEATFQHEAAGRGGTRCAAIASQKGADAAWYALVAVEPLSTYRLSGWIKTEHLQAGTGKGALLNVHDLQHVRTEALVGTQDWTRVEVVFDTDLRDSLQVNCLLGGWGLATGKAWYDDLQLERLNSRVLRPSIAIDAARKGEPISKYVYGQFIEHLGRCIYGGIWAEMLEDRKFFDAVGSEASPWKAAGDPASVRMARQGPFVGEQTPEISLGGGAEEGMVQAGLGLRKGREYVGRIWLAGEPEAGPVRVSLVWGEGPAGRQTIEVALNGEYAKTPLAFTSGGDSDDGRLEIVSRGKGSLRVGTVSLMPADHVHGMRADTLHLLRQLDAPVYRWPGGNFVSGYNWKDGIGDPDRRPPRKNPAWKGIEHNDFGIHEFMAFCDEVRTEPLVVVNSGLGGVDMAVEELQYVNGSEATPMGKLRASHGHPKPFGVKFWGIGNEMYGEWQLGHMPLEEYVAKHNRFADAMRAADPSIVLIAVGSVGKWSETMMARCADHMDLISEHFYCGRQPGLLAHVRQIPSQVRRIAEAHRKYRQDIDALEGKNIRIALDEWNYWYGDHLYGELGTRYFLKDALGVAAGLNEFARQSDMYFMANYAQTVNVIGAMKTTKTDAALETTGLVLALYRRHFGEIPVAVRSDGLLDAAAAWTADGKALTIAVINPTRQELEVPLEIQGAKLAGSGRAWNIAGTDPMAYNEPGKAPQVRIEETTLQGAPERLQVAPWSVSLFELEASAP